MLLTANEFSHLSISNVIDDRYAFSKKFDGRT